MLSQAPCSTDAVTQIAENELKPREDSDSCLTEEGCQMDSDPHIAITSGYRNVMFQDSVHYGAAEDSFKASGHQHSCDNSLSCRCITPAGLNQRRVDVNWARNPRVGESTGVDMHKVYTEAEMDQLEQE